MTLHYLLWLFAFTYVVQSSSSKLDTLYEWKYLKVTPTPRNYLVKSYVLNRGTHITGFDKYDEETFFNYKKAVPFDVDQSKGGRVFLTIVGKSDVRVTLATVTDKIAEHGPVLAPYPDHSWFLNASDCSKMTSVRSVTIDKCNRMWVLDSGRIDRTQVCNAKLLLFDLNTDKLLKVHEMPREISENGKGRGVLVNPVVNAQGAACEKTTVYIADSEGCALVVFNGTEFRRLSGPEFGPDMSRTNFTIAGEWFKLSGGVVPMDLEPAARNLFLAPLASDDLRALNTAELEAVFRGGEKPLAMGCSGVFSSQPTAFRWSKQGVMFAGLAESSIACWRLAAELCSANFDVTVTDAERLQYISALKIIPQSESKSEELLVLSNRLQKSINRNRSFDEINYRVMKASVTSLIEGTKCKNPASKTCSGNLLGFVNEEKRLGIAKRMPLSDRSQGLHAIRFSRDNL